MCPIANAMVSTVRPKAKATPSNPMPTLGKAAARTALPHPPSTNQNVPKNSAPYCFICSSFQLTRATATGQITQNRGAATEGYLSKAPMSNEYDIAVEKERGLATVAGCVVQIR